MQFVGYVDKVTGKNLEEGFMGELMIGKFLSGVLRKYQCPKGHTETNENEDSSVMGFQILDETDSFRNAKELVGYAELHVESERALMRFDHLVCLAYIAGRYDLLSGITKKDVGDNKGRYLSLHDYHGIAKFAKQGLETLSPDWLEQLMKNLEAQG